MSKILKDLWYGNINPQTRRIRRGTEYEKLIKSLCKNEELLLSLLDERQKEAYEKLRHSQDQYEQCAAENHFIVGFRLGAGIIYESFCEDDEFFKAIED